MSTLNFLIYLFFFNFFTSFFSWLLFAVLSLLKSQTRTEQIVATGHQHWKALSYYTESSTKFYISRSQLRIWLGRSGKRQLDRSGGSYNEWHGWHRFRWRVCDWSTKSSDRLYHSLRLCCHFLHHGGAEAGHFAIPRHWSLHLLRLVLHLVVFADHLSDTHPKAWNVHQRRPLVFADIFLRSR